MQVTIGSWDFIEGMTLNGRLCSETGSFFLPRKINFLPVKINLHALEIKLPGVEIFLVSRCISTCDHLINRLYRFGGVFCVLRFLIFR